MLAPMAPHLTEELWQQVNIYKEFKPYQSVHVQRWPVFDRTKILNEEVTVVVQVNGKLRDTMIVSKDRSMDQKVIETSAKKSEKILKFLEGTTVRKVIFIPGKLINFVL